MTRFLALLLALSFAAGPVSAEVISYQGQLQHRGQPFNGTADLEFALYTSPDGSDQVGSTLQRQQPRAGALHHDRL